jgi:hypothetical protein
MPNQLWKSVPAAVVKAAWQARARGLSLRAVASELAAQDMLSPSGRVYLPGSIAAMLRDGAYRVDAAPPAELEGAVDDIDIEIDVADDAQPAADAVDAVSTPPAAVVDTVDVAPSVDAAPPADIEQQPIVDAAVVDGTQQPLTEPKPQPIDAATPAVDAPLVKGWEPRRDSRGSVDATDLLRHLVEYPDLQAAAMASAGLRVEQMTMLLDRPALRETVANWLSWRT